MLFRVRDPDFRETLRGLRVWASNQTQVLHKADDLEQALEAAIAMVAADPDAVPTTWACFDVLADEVEFWLADRQSRHRRLRYVLTGRLWRCDRLC